MTETQIKERLEAIEAKLDDTLRHLHRLDAATTEASNALTAAGVPEIKEGRCLSLAERIRFLACMQAR